MCIIASDMNTNPKKEETPLEPTSPRDSNKLSEPTLPAKRIKLSPFMHESDAPGIRKREERIAKNWIALRKTAREKILAIGGDLAWIRDRIAHGQWGPYIERTFTAAYGLSIRTATTYMQAYEGRDSELALNDWDEFMRQLHGHKPKKLKAPRKMEEETVEENPDLEQTGDEGLITGKEYHLPDTDSRRALESVLVPEEGEGGPYYFRLVVRVLEAKFFASADLTRQTKMDFIIELIKWLENQKRNI